MNGALQLIVFLLPLVLVAIIAVRARRFARLIQEPEKLAEMLSEGTRRALVDAGIDPAHMTIEQIQNDPELLKLVQSDLRKAMLGTLVGTYTDPTRRSTRSPRVPLTYPRAGETSGPSLPPPIDARGTSGSRFRVVLAVILAVALAAALILWR
jgi:hypothetical protein